MRLIVTVDFIMQAQQTHEQGRAGAGMTENKEFFAREELLDLRQFFGSDGRDGIASFLFGLALEQDACSRFEAGKHVVYLFQFSITSPTKQTKIPVMLIHEILSLKTRIATGTRMSDATTFTSTAAMPRFQPER